MPNDQLLTMLRCPQDGSLLAPADETLIAQLNSEIRAGGARNQSGRRVEKPIDGGFVRAAGDLLYPIVDQIPVLLADEAIAVDRVK